MTNKEKQPAQHRNSRGGTAERAAIILEMLKASPQKTFSVKNLAAASGGADREGRAATVDIIQEMILQGIVSESKEGRYRLSNTHRPTLDGVVDMLASGDMFVKVEGEENDIFVESRHGAHALHGDQVKVTVIRRKRNGKPEGEIVSIIERSGKNYVGTVSLSANHLFIKPDSRKMPVDIFVRNQPEGVVDGQKVVAQIVDWKADDKNPTGMITDILGMAFENDTEMHAILAEYDLPYKFTDEVERAANAISTNIPASELASRRDFRSVATFTIDPADAKDFDDALSIRSTGDQRWEVGVHIADVTYYVREGSVLENEARERATSVYLVDRTVPMLPEKLSNELCSLRPNEDKLCFSAVFEIDADLNILNEWFGRTVIRSDRRFAYEEAQAIIEGADGDMREEILTLNTLARKMRAARFRNGAIAFDREEAKFSLDENGKPTGVYFKVQKEANQLIEEFMLLANRKVAEYAGKAPAATKADGSPVKGVKAKRTFVYRVHDQPDPDKLAQFREFIIRFGYYFKADKGKAVAKELNRLMGSIKGKNEENVISLLAVKSMTKAYYSTDNIGHYGLAFPFYTHFTSPIRRYPDMMVHRLMAEYLAGGKSPDRAFYDKQCEHSSQMEVRAAEAERSSIKYKMVEFMLDHVNEEFEGTISSLTEWGMYVELKETHIEGMVSIKDMRDDFYTYSETEYNIRGHRTGKVFTLGDIVRVKVKRADLQRKQLDFELLAATDLASGRVIPIEADNDDSIRTSRSERGAKAGKSAGTDNGKKFSKRGRRR